MSAGVLVHVGLCVTDVTRSADFYTAAFGFIHDRALRLPASAIDALLGIAPRADLHAIYLRLGDFTLELMAFDPPGPRADARTFNHGGLTHLSIAVAELDAAVERAVALGATLHARVGRAAVLRDPDGQLIELLDRAVHDEIVAARAQSAAAANAG